MSPNSPVPPPKAEERESWGALRRHQLAHHLLHQRHEAVGVKSQTVEPKKLTIPIPKPTALGHFMLECCRGKRSTRIEMSREICALT